MILDTPVQIAFGSLTNCLYSRDKSNLPGPKHGIGERHKKTVPPGWGTHGGCR